MIESVSRRAFSSTSGTYNVRASELARERKLNIFNVTVQYLDDTHQVFSLEKKAKGSVLFDQVFHHLELAEKDYFGLQFTENGSPPNATNTEITRWLDSTKSVKKQVGVNAQFWLAVRFYPPEPSRLAEEYTKYLLCLQLRKLLFDGRMNAPKNTALLLASFTVQAELGDYNVTDLSPNYLSDLCLLPKQNAEDERKIKELHKLHRGQSPADAEANFLEHAKRLDCYGVESHPAKDYNGKDIFIGVTSIGIVVFQNNIRINTFSWGKIVKISFKKKRFFIQLKREVCESYDTVLGFNMRSSRAAKALWRCSVERHGFFRLRGPRRRPLLAAIGALAGITQPTVLRTETQAISDAARSRTSNRCFVRRSSSRHRSQSAGGDTSTGTSVGNGARGSRVTSQDEPAPRRAWGEAHSQPDLHTTDIERLISRITPLAFVDESESASETQDDTVTVKLSADDNGVFGFNVRGGSGQAVLVSRVAARMTQLQEGDQVLSINGKDADDLSHEQIVQMIRNTKGVLTLVVKPNAIYDRPEEEIPEEPAVCFVSLFSNGLEGDALEQSMLLLGDSLASGAAVKQYDALFSKATIYDRPEEEIPEEPAVCFVSLFSNGLEGDALEQSMLLLGDSLASGAAVKQYDALLRRVPEMTTCIAKLPKNLNKNRYRDIAPYDTTIVTLKDGQNGDYINASYINMEIPNTDTVLTYIATQGPLASTVGDFWQMVWESESSLIVMLTVLTETGRAKCHQYWAKPGVTLHPTPELTVHTLAEHERGCYVQRECTLQDSHGACRNITQLQYTAWPDHGVPEDTQQFNNFIQLCSRLRNQRAMIPTTVLEDEEIPEQTLSPPMIVHCSAGVGRTGVLILAETALELLQRRAPVYPLDLVRAMRRQRPMCVQNASQYKFVCESIQAAYAQKKQNSNDSDNGSNEQ